MNKYDAILTDLREKDGKIVGKVRVGIVTIDIPHGAKVTLDMNNKSCELYMENDKIVEIICEGKKLIDRGAYIETDVKGRSSPTSPKRKGLDNKRYSNAQEDKHFIKSFATAPYNFVPLNDYVIKIGTPCSFDEFHENLNTGYIDYELETITPLYIRGISSDVSKESKDIPEFFSPGGIYKIPGSSVRGMIRTLVEIMSYSEFKFYDDRYLYYRGLADKSNLRDLYAEKIGKKNKNTGGEDYKFNAGYLTKEGVRYYIIPAKYNENNKQYSRCDINKIGIGVSSCKDYYKFLDDGRCVIIPRGLKGKGSKNVKRVWIINEPDEDKKIHVCEKDIHSYKNDENRQAPDIVSYVDNSRDKGGERLIPCFYVTWKDKEGKERISFGHTAYFRISYEKSIGEHVKQQSKGNGYDIATALFGNESEFATRVFFEDAELDESFIGKDIFCERSYTKVLSTPKPTSFQLYLEQNYDLNMGYDIKKLNHWESDAKIRGYKLYWHKRLANWKLDGRNNINMKVLNEITPIKEHVKFKGRISFENLSDIELGALLFAISLPHNCYHKLGLGKPLGLGSVKITPVLYLTDVGRKYKRLFNGDYWEIGITLKMDFNKYIKAFEKFILENLPPEEKNGATTLWDIERFKELKTMLSWENTNIRGFENMTKYMDMNREEDKGKYTDRNVLLKPSEVIQFLKGPVKGYRNMQKKTV
ncbi:CRISPR-associated protein [Caldanaerobius fijiensis DSM 17918]|uniref:CRISPR-associated protein n=1 Tax=Caldanaerobius fijiensis DSM 17918 TaxID=1121256 RepID=A0A1M5BRN5_9THEO|nr:TIGR03986 family CRISPR-associated RAMP protein [Caldanaerobius fijiensis]SHF45178.1 CRISPR-associated protein [Caldanaerobius fijiensis DSM 17918]